MINVNLIRLLKNQSLLKFKTKVPSIIKKKRTVFFYFTNLLCAKHFLTIYFIKGSLIFNTLPIHTGSGTTFWQNMRVLQQILINLILNYFPTHKKKIIKKKLVDIASPCICYPLSKLVVCQPNPVYTYLDHFHLIHMVNKKMGSYNPYWADLALYLKGFLLSRTFLFHIVKYS